tara:strand:- start:216 stop:416 length:201 start_codon:yes stop_codon:yes gene_type:complete
MDPGTIFIMASGGTIIMGTLGFLIYKIVQTKCCIEPRVHLDSSASTESTSSTVAVHLLDGDTNNVV